MRPRLFRTGALILAFAAGLASSRGQVAALSFGSVGSDSYLDANDRMLGWQFTVNQQLDVLALGWFDLGGDGLNQSHQIGLWDVTNIGSPLALATVPSGTSATLSNHFRYVTLGAPVTLSVGNTYRIAGFDPGVGGDPHVWDIVLPGFEGKEVIAFNNDSRIGRTSGGALGPEVGGFQYPNPTVGVASGFTDGRSVLMGPNMLLSTVPEPATTTLLMTLAAAGAVMLVRARRRAA